MKDKDMPSVIEQVDVYVPEFSGEVTVTYYFTKGEEANINMSDPAEAYPASPNVIEVTNAYLSDNKGSVQFNLDLDEISIGKVTLREYLEDYIYNKYHR